MWLRAHTACTLLRAREGDSILGAMTDAVEVLKVLLQREGLDVGEF